MAEQHAVTEQHRVMRRSLVAAPVACGCLLLGAAGYLAVVDPAAPGTHLPACPLYELTGVWCPGCGLTRATHALLRGHIGTALGYNLFVPIFLGAIIVGWWAWMRSALGRTPMRWLTRMPLAAFWGLAVALVTFGVLRNIDRFAVLAP